MAKNRVDDESIQYNWFQISNIFKFGYYDREVVKTKYFEEFHTKAEWEEMIKKDGLTIIS